MAKVLVTGGAGFIGSHVADELIKQGNDVAIIDNLATGKKENINKKARFYKADITDAKELARIFAKEQPELVAHLAAQASVRASIQEPMQDANTNIIGTINILQECVKNKTRKIVYAASASRYGTPVSVPIKEEARIQALSPYAASKESARFYIESYKAVHGLDFTALVFANVYGSRQDPLGEAGVIAIFSQKIMTDESCGIYGDGTNTRDYVFVRDVARAVVLALQKETKSSTINIGTMKETSVNDLFNALQKQFGKGKRHSLPAVVEPKQSCLDNTKAKKELGWTPAYTLDSGLKETVEWIKNKR